MAAASAQYVVDVAIAMPAGEATAEQLDSLSRTLLAAGASADNFHDAIAQASNALAAAKQASASANEALGAGNAAYRDLEQAALQASKAQEKAAKLGVVPPDVAANAAAATAAVNEYATKLAGLEASAKAAAANEAALVTQLGQVRQASAAGMAALTEQARAQAKASSDQEKAAAKAASDAKAETALARKNLGDLKSGFAELGGPLGFIGAKSAAAKDSFAKLSEQFGSGNASALIAATGALALAAALAVVVAATIAATIAIASWAVGNADAARTAGLNQEALEQLNPAYKAISGSLEDLTYDTGLGQAALDGLAKSLIDAKVPASQLPEALRAAALAESALGQGGAQQFIDQIKAGTLSVNKFADTAEAKFGGVVAKQMEGLGAQSARLKNEIGQTFGGLSIDPVLKGFQRLVALFDDNTAAGSAMKTIFNGLFQPLIDSADTAAIVIEAFVLGFLIGLTKLYIAVKPAIKAVSSFLGFKDASLSSTLALVTKAAEYLAPVVAIVALGFGAVVVAIGVAIAVITAIQIAILALPAAILAAAVALGSVFLNAWQSVTAFLSGIDLATVGHDIITGLVNGLLAAGPAVLHAISGVVGGAIDSAKHLLGIASPSKVFGEIGGNTVAGFVNEVDAGATEAQASVAAMVAPPDAAAPSALAQQVPQSQPRDFGGAAPGSGGGGATGGGGASKSISLTGPFYFYGVTGAEDAEARFNEMLTKAVEGDAAQLGALPGPEQAAA